MVCKSIISKSWSILSSSLLCAGRRRQRRQRQQTTLLQRYCRQYSNVNTTTTTNHDEEPILIVKQTTKTTTTKDENNNIVTITLNRPRQRNALNLQTLSELNEILSFDTPSRKVIIFQANGPMFCSGHDLKELSCTKNNNKQQQHQQQQIIFNLCSQVMQQIQTTPSLTIAAVHGMATAAGCQLVASTDIVLASSCATFAIPGASTIGLPCHTPAVPLVQCIGKKRTMDMLLTGRIISAKEAMDWGLVSRIIEQQQQQKQDPSELVQSAALHLAKSIVMIPGITNAKQTLNQQFSQSLSLQDSYNIATKAMVNDLQTQHTKEGISAFLEKRTPNWKQ